MICYYKAQTGNPYLNFDSEKKIHSFYILFHDYDLYAQRPQIRCYFTLTDRHPNIRFEHGKLEREPLKSEQWAVKSSACGVEAWSIGAGAVGA